MNKSDYIVSPDALQNETHVWFCCPEEVTDAALLTHYHSLLSLQEKQQHKRFHFEKDQHSYLVSHALVRNVLSKYANLSPHQWQFKKNAHGRPKIKQSTSDTPLKFNLTHTRDLCACVVTLGLECGIDAEAMDRKNDLMKIAERMFSRSELDFLSNLKDSDYRNAFFKFWTLRESYVKALGTGLAGSSKDFYFCINDNEITIDSKKTMSDLSADNEQWQFTLLEPTANHIVAVAVNNATRDKWPVVIKKDCAVKLF